MLYTLIEHALSTNDCARYIWTLIFIDILSTGFAAFLQLRGTTHTKSRDVLVNGFELFWNLLLIKSSIANSTPPMWFHFPFPWRSRPVGYVHAALNTSSSEENFPLHNFCFKTFTLQFFYISFEEELRRFQLFVMRSSQHCVAIFLCRNNGVIVKLNEIHLGWITEIARPSNSWNPYHSRFVFEVALVFF